MSGCALAAERSGRGPALMLLHGYTGSGHSMSGLARAFQHDFDTIAPDLPGHGRSADRAAAHAYGFEACVDDLVATLAATVHDSAHWLGYSMGARLALAHVHVNLCRQLRARARLRGQPDRYLCP